MATWKQKQHEGTFRFMFELSCMIPVGIAEDCIKLQFVIDAMDCESAQRVVVALMEAERVFLA